MGCAYLFGVPLWEDASCAQERRTARGGRVETRQEGRTERTEVRQGGRTERTEARTAPGASSPLAQVTGSLTGPITGALAAVGSGLGLVDETTGAVDTTPIIVGGAALAVVLAIASSDKKSRRNR